ncbi:MAG: hypothetical protein O3B08_06710 [Proteobacteria bacterium]|nr:hypothetical protein [Pseudomonadota bacterium]
MPGRPKHVLYDFLTCAIIVLFHFTNYVVYTEYDRFYPDILAVAGMLCAAAAGLTLLLRISSSIFRAAIFSILITLVLGDALFEFGTTDDISLRLIALSATLLLALAVIFFLREHAHLVLMGGFLAMFVATVGVALIAGREPDKGNASARAPDANLPPVVHIVLDEQIGLAGMSSGIPGGARAAAASRRFYNDAGFRVFAGAYSQHFRTETSLAGAFNFDSSARANRYLTRKHYGFSLNRNAYLKSYADKGYRVRVYQSDYFDLCESEGIEIDGCITYRPDFLDRSAIAGLPTAERARLLFGMYYSSIAVVKIARLAGKGIDTWLSGHGIALPALHLWHGRVGPLAVAPTFDRLIRDVSGAAGGTVFFAHLLMPHYPYVYDTACAVRSPISSWRLRHDGNLGNSPESRRLSYAQYFAQVGCVEKRLAELFSALKRANAYDRATIVIHGDHGARIGLTDPGTATVSTLTRADYIDGYSTLFALKTPGIPSGVDLRMLPLSSLLSYAVNRDEYSLLSAPAPTVFMTDGNAPTRSFPLPIFPNVVP